MKNATVLIILFIFVAAVGLVLAQQTEQGGRPLSAKLTGAAEVPGPGDTDGSGSFNATLNAGQGQICYELTVSNIAPSNAAHIHNGGPKDAGPVLVNLTAPKDGSSKDCVSVDKERIQDILKNPENYYVNVHNTEFPDGAVRGQLTK
jgi:CHRD domain